MEQLQLGVDETNSLTLDQQSPEPVKVNPALISQRKAMYGDNFSDIAEAWGEYLDDHITGVDVAHMMALMKQVRIDATTDLINAETKVTGDPEYIASLNNSLTDSKTDQANYLWIAANWDKYSEL